MLRVNLIMWDDFKSACILNNTTASVELRGFMDRYTTKAKPSAEPNLTRTLNFK